MSQFPTGRATIPAFFGGRLTVNRGGRKINKSGGKGASAFLGKNYASLGVSGACVAAAFFLLASPMIWGRETRVNKTAKIPMYKTSLIPIFSGRIFTIWQLVFASLF